MSKLWPLLILLALAGCRRDVEELPALAEEFVYGVLGYSPVAATGVGYHQHKGIPLDGQLDDLTEPGIAAQKQFLSSMRRRLTNNVVLTRLGAEERADYDMLIDQIELQLLELETIQSYRHNPTLYVELIGNGLFSPYVLEYAPKEERFKHIISRLKGVPKLLEAARRNLRDAPEVWNRVAREENEGNIGLIDKTLREAAPPALRTDYGAAAATALDALRSFNSWLENDLARRTSDWRLPAAAYAKKFRYALGVEAAPDEILADAEAQIKAVRRQMFDLSLPLHKKWYPTHRDPVDLNLIVNETLTRVADKHATPETYFADARRDLEEARAFVKAKNLLALPPRDNLQVIETPEFMRGIYGVGGFNPAPALEPKLGAFYWITPIPRNWPKERIESKLREYNYYGLKLLTIHEAMPGHYVQLEYANDIQPLARRLLRGVLGNGPYIEGWAVYATEMMLDEGYLDGSPELRLTFLKQQLRMLANTVLDIRLHTKGMTDEQAMSLMLGQTFQEKEEATAKLQRAKLSSCQLPTYYVGYRDWVRLRDAMKQRQGGAWKLNQFHERALKAGALPLRTLGALLGAGAAR